MQAHATGRKLHLYGVGLCARSPPDRMAALTLLQERLDRRATNLVGGDWNFTK